LGFFGAQDDVVPVAEVRELDARLVAHRVDANVTIYPDVGHYFVAGSQLDPHQPRQFPADYSRACESMSATLSLFHRTVERSREQQQ
jgi:dienelactone hydrolase